MSPTDDRIAALERAFMASTTEQPSVTLTFECPAQDAAEMQRYCDEHNAAPVGWCRIYYRIRVIPDPKPPTLTRIVAPESDPTSPRVLDDEQ